MATPTTRYIVIPFSRGARGKISAGQALPPFTVREKALAAGEREAAAKLGALVLEAPPADDEYATPKLVDKFGTVPDEAIDALAA